MNRIDLLASLSKNSNTLLDLGCDHGYVLIKALKYYNVNFAIASDISGVALKNAIYNVSKNKLESKVKFVISDGLTNINDDFDTLVIAGMGGKLISKILEEKQTKVINKKLILEANKDRFTLRKTLYSLGFMITDEYSFYDKNIYYEIIVAESNNVTYDINELKYGPILLKKKNDAFIKYYNKMINNLIEIISKSNNENIINEKKKELNEIKEILL